MISNNNINSGSLQRGAAVVVTFFKTVYNKTISRLGFYDILNNQVWVSVIGHGPIIV